MTLSKSGVEGLRVRRSWKQGASGGLLWEPATQDQAQGGGGGNEGGGRRGFVEEDG